MPDTLAALVEGTQDESIPVSHSPERSKALVVCRDFLRGHCTRPQCRFYHPSPIEVLANASTFNSYIRSYVEPCQDYLRMGVCPRGSSCPYFHPQSREELDYIDSIIPRRTAHVNPKCFAQPEPFYRMCDSSVPDSSRSSASRSNPTTQQRTNSQTSSLGTNQETKDTADGVSPQFTEQETPEMTTVTFSRLPAEPQSNDTVTRSEWRTWDRTRWSGRSQSQMSSTYKRFTC